MGRRGGGDLRFKEMVLISLLMGFFFWQQAFYFLPSSNLMVYGDIAVNSRNDKKLSCNQTRR